MKPFEEMSPAEKRVAIAADVIEHAEAGRFHARRASYVYLSKEDAFFDPKDETQLGDFLQKHECQVCQLGGLLYATAVLADKVRVCDVTTYNGSSLDLYSFSHYLQQFFDLKQLDLMEAVFEGWWHPFDESLPAKWNALEAAKGKFYDAYPDAKDRMIAICKNIIANKGTFCPEKEAFNEVA